MRNIVNTRIMSPSSQESFYQVSQDGITVVVLARSIDEAIYLATERGDALKGKTGGVLCSIMPTVREVLHGW